MKIDWWTLGLQTINVVILIWLLGHFFWRPIAAIIDERRTAASKLLSDAEAAKTEADRLRAEIEEKRAGFAEERDAILAAARAEAEKLRAGILEDARKQADHLHATAKADLDQLAKRAEAAWTSRAAELAVDIAGRLVGRLDTKVAQDAFLDWLVTDLKALPDPVRQSVTERDTELEVVTPSELSADETRHYQRAISEALGTTKPFHFSTDPDLIGGVALTGPNLVAESSWRADLRTILEELDDGRKA